MSLWGKLARNIFWSSARGVVLGAALAFLFPMERTTAQGHCHCHDSGKGKWSCPSATARKCTGGTQICSVRCS